jgi:rsbT co-antagonist protein RsbR
MGPGASQHEQYESVDRSRIERMVDVLSYASVSAYDEALEHAKVAGQDNFGALEEALRLVIGELREARQRNDAAVQALERSKAELEEKLSTIENQKTAIEELSTPILEIWTDIITLPIIGAIDTGRAVEMTERLLRRIVDGGARCVIIDLTGVEVVDTMTADHLVKMTKATRLLGCFSVITGIGPEIARTLVDLDLNLGGMKTLRSLKNGLQACFAYLEDAEGGKDRRTIGRLKADGSRA